MARAPRSVVDMRTPATTATATAAATAYELQFDGSSWDNADGDEWSDAKVYMRNLKASTEFPIPSFIEVFQLSFREFPGLWATSAASYCPSRAGELPKQNLTKSHARWDGKLCRWLDGSIFIGYCDSVWIQENVHSTIIMIIFNVPR